MYRELPVDFKFTASENEVIVNSLLSLSAQPYQFYTAFKQQIRLIISELPAMERFIQFTAELRSRSSYDFPFVFVENAPIDPELPELGNDDPVQEKYLKKKTFVAEGFLQMYAELTAQHPIAYLNVNDGDVFQDIFPKESMKDTQSQKSLGPIYFHKDFPNHFVRPDFVNILSLRSHHDNEIYTTFVSNRDIIQHLSPSTLDRLRSPEFYTPYDDITINSGKVPLGRAPDHSILAGTHHFRFFENRTIGLNPEAQAAVQELLNVAHTHKKRILMKHGDFVSISNNLSLHGREVMKISNIEESRKRWSLKTVNVHSCAPHFKYFVNGTDYLVNG